MSEGSDSGDGAGADERGRTRPRVVAIGVAILFALQLVYVGMAEEPYPAIMMPRFGWAGPTQVSSVDIPIPEIALTYADGTTKHLDQQALLGDIPTGHQAVVMGNIMTPLPPEPIRRRAPEGKFQPPEWLFPGYRLARVSRDRPEHVASLQTWLAARARTFYTGAPPTRCVVTWYTDSFPYDPNKSPSETGRGHVLNGTFEVELDDAKTPT